MPFDRRPPRVAIAGLGLASGFGGREATWGALRAGRSAIRAISPAGLEALGPWGGAPSPIAEAVRRGDDPAAEPLESLLFAVADEALADAGLSNIADRGRLAVVIGWSKGGVRSLATLHAGRRFDDATQARLWRQSWPGYGATALAARLGATGPSLAPVAACASGLIAVLRAAGLVRRGECEAALAGAVDASLEPWLLAAFRSMRVLARLAPGDDPAAAVRPWDRRRSGFLVGEGGALFVLEREDAARARGARPCAILAGGAIGSDAFHVTDLDPDPAGLAGLIGRALHDAGVGPSAIEHVNVHGTATRANDPLECQALRRALGGQADRLACTANKAQIGHLLGGAGAAELAIACLSIRDQFVPPTLNLDDPDPACDLDATPRVGRPLAIGGALKLALGFGGHQAAAVLVHPDAEARP